MPCGRNSFTERPNPRTSRTVEEEMSATSGGVPVGLDGTHLNSYGAAWTAYDWACLLAQSDCPLKNYLSPLVQPPAEEVDFLPRVVHLQQAQQAGAGVIDADQCRTNLLPG